MSNYNNKMEEKVDIILKKHGIKKDKVQKQKKGTWYEKVKAACFNITILYHFSYVRLMSKNKRKTGVVVVDNKEEKVHVQNNAFEIINEEILEE